MSVHSNRGQDNIWNPYGTEKAQVNKCNIKINPWRKCTLCTSSPVPMGKNKLTLLTPALPWQMKTRLTFLNDSLGRKWQMHWIVLALPSTYTTQNLSRVLSQAKPKTQAGVIPRELNFHRLSAQILLGQKIQRATVEPLERGWVDYFVHSPTRR